MAKINFKKFGMFTDISQTSKTEVDVSRVFSDTLYKNATGIVAHDLALRIYRSEGEIEVNAEELALIKSLAKNGCTPLFIDSLDSNIKE